MEHICDYRYEYDAIFNIIKMKNEFLEYPRKIFKNNSYLAYVEIVLIYLFFKKGRDFIYATKFKKETSSYLIAGFYN